MSQSFHPHLGWSGRLHPLSSQMSACAWWFSSPRWKKQSSSLHLCSCQWPRLGDKSCVMALPFILSRNCLGLPLQKQQLSSGSPRHVGVILGIIWTTLSTEYPLQEIQVHGEVQAEPGTMKFLQRCGSPHLYLWRKFHLSSQLHPAIYS